MSKGLQSPEFEQYYVPKSKVEEHLKTWTSVLGFAYDNLSATEFDYLLDQSPFSTYMTSIAGVYPNDPDEWVEHQPFETHAMETTLYFQ